MRMMAVFRKDLRLRHIGHLDIMRAMQRALRRSGLPVSYSNGFNPHILLTFASALSVGAVGERELMEVTLDRDISPEDFLSAMNGALPPEMQLLSAKVLPDRHPALMAMVAAQDVSIAIPDAQAREALTVALPAFLAQEHIEALRKTKSGEKVVDIRPLIFHLSAEEDGLRATLALTEGASCKPDMLITALSAFAGVEAPRSLVTRHGLLGDDHGTLQPLEDM